MGRDRKKGNSTVVQSKGIGFKAILLLGALVGVLALLPSISTFNHGYVLDDVSAITENHVVQKGTESFGTIWKTNYRYGYWSDPGSLYRPLTLTLFAWEWQHWPNDPHPAHVINVLLYVGCAVALYLLLLSWFGRSKFIMAGVGAVVFALHPIHTEVVANIKSADELLATFFSLIALTAIWKNGARVFSLWLLLAVGAFFLAITSKESVVTIIPIVPIAFYFFSEINWKKALIPEAWLLVPFSIYMMLRKAALGTFSSADVIAGADNVLVRANGIEYYTTAIKICGLYLWKLLVPHPLSHDYSLFQIPVVGFEDIFFWISLAVYVGLFWVLIKGWKERSIWSFSIVFFLVTFSLYSNLFLMIGTHFGERVLFIPSIGFAISVAALFWKWSMMKSLGQFKLNKAVIPIASLAVILILYGFKSNDRNKEWASEFDLYEADVINSPNSARVHYRLGMAYMKERALKTNDEKQKNAWLRKAVGSLKNAIKIWPGFADAHSELGLAYQRLGYLELAEERYQHVLGKRPDHKVTLNNMGTVLFEQAKFELAIEHFLRALKKDPRYIDAMGNLASCYGTIGQYENAIKWFKKAIDLEPRNASYYYFVGVTYQRMNNSKEAQVWLNQAYVLDPSMKPK